MISGHIDDRCEARIALQVGSGSEYHSIDFLVDTGFNGFLALSPGLVSDLALQTSHVQRGVTADGRAGFFQLVDVFVLWHDSPMFVQAQIMDEPMIGTRLLAGNELSATWRPGGKIVLTPTN